ncbi:hypothetical protein [Undibacterium aquatile]|uniref:Uncharacterized protein n=1 Tax=Undibacterium aquatile TaxID=1537398 RepID=A0ABR6XAX0_9BURK|nr:hypothetical protein [Undibacterium aquatile]MBC3810078.1 hypothetical protein [Undibacterium aquatile]
MKQLGLDNCHWDEDATIHKKRGNTHVVIVGEFVRSTSQLDEVISYNLRSLGS